ncbi:MAG: hypothetical protein K0R66_433 [Gammaproteobacteria bacterium]|jgi:hypothetical protein|nr:hypothetical protein [Gammaproteobacteria bacterium]
MKFLLGHKKLDWDAPEIAEVLNEARKLTTKSEISSKIQAGILHHKLDLKDPKFSEKKNALEAIFLFELTVAAIKFYLINIIIKNQNPDIKDTDKTTAFHFLKYVTEELDKMEIADAELNEFLTKTEIHTIRAASNAFKWFEDHEKGYDSSFIDKTTQVVEIFKAAKRADECTDSFLDYPNKFKGVAKTSFAIKDAAECKRARAGHFKPLELEVIAAAPQAPKSIKWSAWLYKFSTQASNTLEKNCSIQ